MNKDKISKENQTTTSFTPPNIRVNGWINYPYAINEQYAIVHYIKPIPGVLK